MWFHLEVSYWNHPLIRVAVEERRDWRYWRGCYNPNEKKSKADMFPQREQSGFTTCHNTGKQRLARHVIR